MDDMSNTMPKVEDGDGKPEGTQQSAWVTFCNWARQPASQGFIVVAASVAASVAVALVLTRPNRRLPILY